MKAVRTREFEPDPNKRICCQETGLAGSGGGDVTALSTLQSLNRVQADATSRARAGVDRERRVRFFGRRRTLSDRQIFTDAE
jgi:hypothetical protein